MDFISNLSLFSPLDAAALAMWLTTWLSMGWIIDFSRSRRPSVSGLMETYRRRWMIEYITRDSRIFDSNILATLRQGTTFFASASMILLGGGLALLGDTERLIGVARDLTLDPGPAVIWELKLIAILLFVANAFLKFVWAHRLFGYCAVIMAAVPNAPDHPQAEPMACQAADLANSASRSYNRGMRALYFALAGLAWLLGPEALVLATAATLVMLWRREFSSRSRRALMTPPAPLPKETAT